MAAKSLNLSQIILLIPFILAGTTCHRRPQNEIPFLFLGSSEAVINAGSFWTLTDTGQTACYNASTSQSCGDGPSGFPGQDGDYIDSPRSRRLSGPNRSAAYPDDPVTTDSVTGLFWKTCAEGQTWNSVALDCTGAGNSGNNYGATTILASSASSACSLLNSAHGGAGYAGRTDWRIPEIWELRSLDNQSIVPTLEPSFFPNSGMDAISGTPSSLGVNWVWTHELGSGVSSKGPNTGTGYVHCVSGVIMHRPSFIDNHDGTILDATTSLVWQKCTAPLTSWSTSCSGAPTGSYSWQQALQYCQALTLRGRNWRLPNVNELRSLVDYTRSSYPLIDQSMFPATVVASGYFSSTTFPGSPSMVRGEDFQEIGTTGWGKNADGTKFVRCVSTNP